MRQKRDRGVRRRDDCRRRVRSTIGKRDKERENEKEMREAERGKNMMRESDRVRMRFGFKNPKYILFRISLKNFSIFYFSCPISV